MKPDFQLTAANIAIVAQICRKLDGIPLGDQRGVGWSLSFQGCAVTGLQDYARANALLEESLAIFRELGDKDGIVFQLQSHLTHRERQHLCWQPPGMAALTISR